MPDIELHWEKLVFLAAGFPTATGVLPSREDSGERFMLASAGMETGIC